MTNRRRSPGTLTLKDAVDAGLRVLTSRPRSEWEVRQRLSRRFASELVESAVLTLKDRGLIDDPAFVLFWLQSRERHRPRGASVLRWELRRMGLDRDVIDGALEGVDEEENAYLAALKALPAHRPVTDPSALRDRVVPYLRRRGFGPGPASRAVARLLEELPDPVDGDIIGENQADDPEYTEDRE